MGYYESCGIPNSGMMDGLLMKTQNHLYVHLKSPVIEVVGTASLQIKLIAVEGGIHLTSPAFLPNALLKELTATEDQYYSRQIQI